MSIWIGGIFAVASIALGRYASVHPQLTVAETARNGRQTLTSVATCAGRLLLLAAVVVMAGGFWYAVIAAIHWAWKNS